MIASQKYQVKYLTSPEVETLMQAVKGNPKYELLTLLMLDAGLRVSEAISLQVQNFLFKERILRVKSLKKRKKEIFRDIPISTRLYHKLSQYLAKLKKLEPDTYLFPANKNNTKAGHIHRTAVHKYYSRLGKKKPQLAGMHPHKLRHTCGAMLIGNGTQPENIKAILGHKDINTTLNFYAHISSDSLRQNIETAFGEKPKRWQRIMSWMFGKEEKKSQIITLDKRDNHLLIGREEVIKQLSDLVHKNINALLLGPAGIGKTQLLDNIKLNKPVIRIDEFSGIKTTLAGILLEMLNGDKEHCRQLLYADVSDIDKRMTKESIKSLTSTLISITEKYEYTIIIDDITRITPAGVKVLENLRQHFHLICAARQIKADRATFLSNFERIELKEFTRKDAITMIEALSYDLDIEDKDLFRNHIYEQAGGNPQYIYELIERYRKEGFITAEAIRSIRHGGGRKEIDMSIFVLLAIAGLAIMRYMTSELDDSSFRFIGGSAMVLLIFARYFFNYTKRKFA